MPAAKRTPGSHLPPARARHCTAQIHAPHVHPPLAARVACQLPQEGIATLSSFERYKKELLAGQLTWAPMHESGAPCLPFVVLHASVLMWPAIDVLQCCSAPCRHARLGGVNSLQCSRAGQPPLQEGVQRRPLVAAARCSDRPAMVHGQVPCHVCCCRRA